jgi:RNA polymerase sigma factor (sigma-70 family)
VTDRATPTTVEGLLREYAPQVLGVVARRHGHFAEAEDAVQEALIAASVQWPAAGLPTNPRGWLYEVARRRLTDQVRSDTARRRREELVARDAAVTVPFAPPADADLGIDQDDSLVLLSMCCHPSLTPTSAIALTLRAVGGLTTAEIAAAFLVPEATMAQRISRAKQTIRSSGVPFALPGEGERLARHRAMLQVLYLMFNEGYTSTSGPALHRPDLSGEAIRLTRMLHALLPDAEVAGLLALMLLTDARRDARSGPNGELIPLDEQDRGLWSRDLITEGIGLVSAAMARGSVGPYQLQAAIAALHDEAVNAEATDWTQIMALYGVLRRMADNPMVELNHAVAAAMVHGPQAGLDLLESLDADPRVAGHYRLDAVRGHLFERLGDPDRAIAHFRTAAARTASFPERNFLTTKAARLAAMRA